MDGEHNERRYNPLPTTADLSLTALKEALKLLGESTIYILHVSRVDSIRAIELIRNVPQPITTVTDVKLAPYEWFVHNFDTHNCIGSKIPS